MKKHIKDYVSLYIGCELLLEQEGIGINLGLYYPDVWTKEGNIESNGINVYFTESSVKGKVYAMNFNQCKLSLRPISDMTESERKEIYKIVFKRDFPTSGRIGFLPDKSTFSDPRWILQTGVDRLAIEMSGSIWADCDLQTIKYNEHLITAYLLKQRFDIFGLIENEIAIDKTKLVKVVG